MPPRTKLTENAAPTARGSHRAVGLVFSTRLASPALGSYRKIQRRPRKSADNLPPKNSFPTIGFVFSSRLVIRHWVRTANRASDFVLSNWPPRNWVRIVKFNVDLETPGRRLKEQFPRRWVRFFNLAGQPSIGFVSQKRKYARPSVPQQLTGKAGPAEMVAHGSGMTRC